MTRKTEQFMARIQMSQMFDEIYDDLYESRIPNPRLHAVTNFPEIGTVIIVYDKFCAVIEVNKKTEKLEYVALGRSDGNDLSRGVLELVDIRMLDDDALFKRAVKIFKKLSDYHTPHIVRDLPDITNRDQIVGTILDCWKLASELEMAGGWQ